MNNKLCVLMAAVLISGCSSITVDHPKPMRDTVFVAIHIVDELPTGNTDDTLAIARQTNGVGEIFIRRDVYPLCITHEVMHLFSGDWHGDDKSSEFCYIEK